MSKSEDEIVGDDLYPFALLIIVKIKEKKNLKESANEMIFQLIESLDVDCF